MTAKRQPYKIKLYPNAGCRGKVIAHPLHGSKDDEEEAAFLLAKIGGNVKFLPESNIPGNKNPDCEWRGISWEIKTIYSEGSTTVAAALRAGAKQSSSLILNVCHTKRTISQVANDSIHFLKTEATAYAIKRILIVCKNYYCQLDRSMLK